MDEQAPFEHPPETFQKMSDLSSKFIDTLEAQAIIESNRRSNETLVTPSDMETAYRLLLGPSESVATFRKVTFEAAGYLGGIVVGSATPNVWANTWTKGTVVALVAGLSLVLLSIISKHTK